jgi:hypothetical protein
MGFVGAFIVIAALVGLAVTLRRPETEDGWRSQAEGLRKGRNRREMAWAGQAAGTPGKRAAGVRAQPDNPRRPSLLARPKACFRAPIYRSGRSRNWLKTRNPAFVRS